MSVTTIEVANGRVVGDASIMAFDDGGFYNHNGAIYYKNVKALLKAEPNLSVQASKPYTHKGGSKKSAHNAAEVTRLARYFKETLDLKVLNKYLPFYDIKKIIGNIGTTQDKNLVVQWYTPSSGGVKPGAHFSMCQVRGENPKWRTLRGSDSKTVESMIFDDGPVYCVCGTGDFLILKSLGLNYLAFAADGAAQNNPHIEYIKKKVGNRTIRLIPDNDPSGFKVADYLRSMGFKVQVFNWKRIKMVEEKMDLRDLAWKIAELKGNIETIKKLITQGVTYE